MSTTDRLAKEARKVIVERPDMVPRDFDLSSLRKGYSVVWQSICIPFLCLKKSELPMVTWLEIPERQSAGICSLTKIGFWWLEWMLIGANPPDPTASGDCWMGHWSAPPINNPILGSPVVPVNFFPVTPLRRIKMPSQVKIIKKWMSQGWGSGKQMLEPGKQD